jgi:hypothetical protein
MARDVLMQPAWRSAVVVDDAPLSARHLHTCDNGWRYYVEGRVIYAVWGSQRKTPAAVKPPGKV